MSLLGFPNLPPEGEVNLCEVDGRLYSGFHQNGSVSAILAYTKSTENHPQVTITREMLHGSTREDIARNVFSPVQETILKRLVHVWYEQGLTEVIHVAAEPETHQPLIITKIASFLLNVLKSVDKVQHYFQPHLHESGIRLIEMLSLTRNWMTSPIRCIAWHPFLTKLAVATVDDSIRIYSTDSKLVPILKLRRQKKITCMQWRPLSDSELAVGCETGIIVWTIDPSSVVTRPSSNNAQILEASGHAPLVSLTWSPFGDLLASAAAHDSSIRIWDVDMIRSETIRRSAGGGLCLMQWSPDGTKLFSASSEIVFRMWNTENWTAERWNVGSGRIQAACFSRCGTILLFCTDEEPIVFALRCDDNGIWAQKDSSNNTATSVLCLSRIDEKRTFGSGLIKSLCWDPNNNHLALLFKDSSYVAIFNTITHPVLQITPCCIVNGLEYENPSTIAFQQNFSYGSCLTIAWSSGRIQHFPLVVSMGVRSGNSNELHDGSRRNYSDLNRSVF